MGELMLGVGQGRPCRLLIQDSPVQHCPRRQEFEARADPSLEKLLCNVDQLGLCRDLAPDRHRAAEPCETISARVSSTALVRYRGNDYSVPTAHGFQAVLSRVLLVAPRTVGHAASGNLGWHGSICEVG